MADKVYLESFFQLLLNDKSVDFFCQPLPHFNYISVGMSLICSGNQVVCFWVELLYHVLDVEHIVRGSLETMGKYVQNVGVSWLLGWWLQLADFMENYGLL